MTTNDIIKKAMYFKETGIYTTDINSIVISFTKVELNGNMFKFYMHDYCIACVHIKAIRGGVKNEQQQT